MRLITVSAKRYPGYLAYSELIAAFADGFSLRVDLREQTIAPKFEVFVIQARSMPFTDAALPREWDRFDFGDFILASIFLLRREEWIEERVQDLRTHGAHAVEQRFGSIADWNESRNAVLVDSGLCLLSRRGAQLVVEADTFPLVLQLHYDVTSSRLPEAARIPLNEAAVQ